MRREFRSQGLRRSGVCEAGRRFYETFSVREEPVLQEVEGADELGRTLLARVVVAAEDVATDSFTSHILFVSPLSGFYCVKAISKECTAQILNTTMFLKPKRKQAAAAAQQGSAPGAPSATAATKKQHLPQGPVNLRPHAPKRLEKRPAISTVEALAQAAQSAVGPREVPGAEFLPAAQPARKAAQAKGFPGGAPAAGAGAEHQQPPSSPGGSSAAAPCSSWLDQSDSNSGAELSAYIAREDTYNAVFGQLLEMGFPPDVAHGAAEQCDTVDAALAVLFSAGASEEQDGPDGEGDGGGDGGWEDEGHRSAPRRTASDDAQQAAASSSGSRCPTEWQMLPRPREWQTLPPEILRRLNLMVVRPVARSLQGLHT